MRTTTPEAEALFFRALPAAADFRALRPIAAAVLACREAIDGGFGKAATTFAALGERLAAAFDALDADWPWPEGTLTYENALIPRALIAVGAKTGDERLTGRGREALDWLIRVQTTPSGTFSPIGNRGWWPRSGTRAQFDQQPIEAASMVMASVEAYLATGVPEYRIAAEAAYGWFLGDNDLRVAVADVEGGGCRDGLSP